MRTSQVQVQATVFCYLTPATCNLSTYVFAHFAATDNAALTYVTQ